MTAGGTGGITGGAGEGAVTFGRGKTGTGGGGTLIAALGDSAAVGVAVALGSGTRPVGAIRGDGLAAGTLGSKVNVWGGALALLVHW